MSLIKETQERNDPQRDVQIDVPKIGSTERLPEPPDVPDPLEQPSILPEAAPARTSTVEAVPGSSDDELVNSARDIQRSREQQFDSYTDLTQYQPPQIPEIDISHFQSLADAKLKGGVQPTYYEQENTRVKANLDLNGPRLEFDEEFRFTESSVHNGNYSVFNPKDASAGITRMQDRSFGTVPNLDGLQPLGGRITLPGFVNNHLSNPNLGGTPGGAQLFETYINEVFADLEQRFNITEGVLGLDTSAIDNRAWGYREFDDGAVFNPFGNLALLKHAALNNPKGFIFSLIPTVKNPLGVFGTVFAGSEWGDYSDGFLGAFTYATDITRYFVAAGQDVWTTAQGENTGRWEDSKTMQALQGRDFSIAAAQRIDPKTGRVENPLSLWAADKPEPKTWREWSQRNWLAKNIIVPIDKAKQIVTGRSGLDDEVSVPPNLIGLQEFATGLVLDGFISAGALRAVEETTVLQKNAQTARAGVTPDDTLDELRIKSQAKEKEITKLRRKKFNQGTLTVADQSKLDDLIDQQQTILGYEKQFETFGSVRVTDGSEAAYMQDLDETEQLLQEIEKQAPTISDEAGNIVLGNVEQKVQAARATKADVAFGAPQPETGPETIVDLQPIRPKVQTATDYQYKAKQFESLETIENGDKASRVPAVYDETSGTIKVQASVDNNLDVPAAPVVKGQDDGTQIANRLRQTQQQLDLDPTNPELQNAAREAYLDYSEYVFNESPEAFQTLEETVQRTFNEASERVARLEGELFRAQTLPGFDPNQLEVYRLDIEDANAERLLAAARLDDLGTIKEGAARPRTFLENLQDEAHELRIARGTNPGDRDVLNNLLEVERTLDEQMFVQFPDSFQGRKIAAEGRLAGLRQRAAANQRRLQELQSNPVPDVEEVNRHIALDAYYQRELEYAQIRADDLKALAQETEIVDPRLSGAIEEFVPRVEAQVLGGDLEGVARSVDEVLEGAVVDAEAVPFVEEVGPTDIQVEAQRADTDIFESRKPVPEAVPEPLEPTIATAVDITPEGTVQARAVNNAVDEIAIPKVDDLVEPENLEQAVDQINEFEESLLSTRQRLEELGADEAELAKIDAGLERIGLTKQYINTVYDPDAAKQLADRLKKVELKNLDAQIDTARRTLEDRQAAIGRGRSRAERKELRAAAAETQEQLEALQKQRSDLDEIRKQLGQADRLAEEVSLKRQFEFLDNHPRLQGEQEKAFLKPFRDKIQEARTKTQRVKAQKEFVDAANEAFATRILTNNPEFIAAKETLEKQIATSPNAKVKKQLQAQLRALEAEFKPLKFKGLSTQDNIAKEIGELQKEIQKRGVAESRKTQFQARIKRLENLSDELSGVVARPPSPAVGLRNLRKLKDMRSTLTRLIRQSDNPETIASLQEQVRKIAEAEKKILPTAEPELGAQLGRTVIEPIVEDIPSLADDVPIAEAPVSTGFIPEDVTRNFDTEITSAKQEYVNATNQADQVSAAAKVQGLEAEQAAVNSKVNDVKNRGTTRDGNPKNMSVPEATDDFRFTDSSFNSTPPPKQQYVPHISKDGKLVHRSPLSEWNNDLEKSGKQMVRTGQITTHPDLIPLGQLDEMSTENLGLLYQRVANQNADLLAIYKQEVVKVSKLAEQYPIGMNQAKSQTMAGGVPEQASISVPNSKPGNFETADGVPLASVKPVVNETYQFGTRLTNTADAFADPTSIAGRSPLGTVHTLTQDVFYAEDIAKSPVQNVPNSTSRAYNARTGTVIEVQVNADRVLDGSKKLPNGFKNELFNGLADPNSPQLKTIVGSNGGIEELAQGFEEAIEKSTNYKDLISRLDDAIEDWSVTRGFAEFDELASLQAQRAVTRALQASGIQAVEVSTKVGNKITKQLGVVDPAILRATNFQQMDVGSVLEQVARQANAETWQHRFYNKKATKSKFSKANAEKAKMQLAAQRVHETEKKLQQSHKNHADLAREMAQREVKSEAEKLQKMLDRDEAIDKVFKGKNDKVIQTDLSRTLPETFKRASPRSEYLNDDYGEILSADRSLREPIELTETWDSIPNSVNGVKASPDIKARMQRLRQQKRAAMSKQHAREASEAMQEQAVRTEIETAQTMYMSDKVNLRETSLNPVEQWLAAAFDMQWKMLQPLKKSNAGLIREHLGLTAKIANGLVDTQVRMVMVKEVRRHNQLVKQILGKKGAGITGKQLRKLNLDIIEIGAHHKLNGGHELLPAALEIQKQRYDTLVERLKNLGVSDEDIFDLFESSISMSNKADEARMIANALGQDLGSVNQIGYFSRVMDRDVANWLKKVEDEGVPTRNKIVNPTAMDLDITRSRQAFHYVPEDRKVMSWLMGIDETELDRIIFNEEFAATLQKLENANPGVLDNWVDMGVLSKMQYTTNELNELMLKKYGKDLPLSLRGDMFLDDPLQVWNMYGDFLKKQSERSAIYKNLVEDGLDAGWSVPKSVFDDLPDELAPGEKGISKKDFVLWNEGSVRQFLPNYKGGDIYVHKAVNNQVESMVHLFGHPELMNTSSQIVSEISRFYNQSLLLHPFYSINVAVDSTLQFFAAGGDLLRLPQAYWDLGKALRTGNLEHFDNVQKVYQNWDGTKLLTKREFFNEFMLTNSIDITPSDLPGLGGQIGSTGKTWSQLINLRRGYNWAWNYTRRFGAKNAAQQFFKDISDVQGKFFAPLAAAASHAEAASKWALAQTWLDTRRGNDVGQFLRDYGGNFPTRKINSGKQAWDWMQDYYTTWNTAGAGAFGAATGFIQPFSTYAYWNTPANIRKFMKNPQQYVNMARTWGFLNRDMSIDDKVNEYSVPSWLGDNMAFALGKDSFDNWVMFRPRGMDSRADIVSAITLTGKTSSQMMGFYPGTSQDQVNQILAEVSDTRIFADLIEGFGPIFGQLGSLYTGEDIQGRPIANPNQVEGRLTGLDWRTEYVLSLYPPIQRAIKANAFNLLGQPEIIDSRTKVPTKAPVAGKILGNERVEYDTSKYKNPLGILKVFQYLGAPITVIDADRNLTWSLSRLRQTLNKVSSVRGGLDKEMVEMKQKGQDITFARKFAKLKKRHDGLLMKEIQLAKDTLLVAEYFRVHGIASSEDIRIVEQQIYNEYLRQNPQNVYQGLLDMFRANEKEVLDAFESTIKVDMIDINSAEIDLGVGGTDANADNRVNTELIQR